MPGQLNPLSHYTLVFSLFKVRTTQTQKMFNIMFDSSPVNFGENHTYLYFKFSSISQLAIYVCFYKSFFDPQLVKNLAPPLRIWLSLDPKRVTS